MSKKPTTKNVIENLNLEIDYDKLAEAIVRATKAAEDKKEKKKTVKKLMLTIGNCSAFAALVFASIAGIVLIWEESVDLPLKLWGRISATVILVLLAFGSLLSLNECFDDDYQDSVALYTANITLAALIVAVIALLKA